MHIRVVSPFDSAYRATAAGVGLLCMVAALVGGSLKAAGIEIGAVNSPLRQVLLGALGAVVTVASFISTDANKRIDVAPARPLNELSGEELRAAVLADAVLMEKVLDSMPPMFLKRYPRDEHLYDNEPFRTFQGDKPEEIMAVQDLITADHRRGDQIAGQSGASVQLETSDPFPSKKTQTILTFKRRLNHQGSTYIAGWYIPIDPRNLQFDGKVLEVQKLRETVVFRLVLSSKSDQDPYVIDVGMSLAAARKSRVI
jgi:hypothetical protein